MENDDLIRVKKKTKTKKKLKIFRILTFVFAALFVVSLGFAVFSSVSASSKQKSQAQNISKLNTDIATLTSEKVKLTNDVNSLNEQISNLTSQYNSASSTSAELQLQIAELQQQINALSSDSASSAAELQKEINSLNSRLETAKSANSVLTSKNESLSSEITSLENKISKLEKENQAYSDEIIALGGTIPEVKNEETNSGVNTEEKKESSAQTGKIAYLTFDDGTSENTNDILDILAEYGVKATFFPYWKGKTENYKRMVNEGHAVGNHTYSHEYDEVYSTAEGFEEQITTLNNKIASVTGYTPTIFRFPGGSNNTVHKNYNKDIMNQAFDVLEELGMEYFDWNIYCGDTDSTPATKEQIVNNVMNGVASNEKNKITKQVILMHDLYNKKTTVQALPEIIEGLIAKGYSFGVLTDDDAPVLHSRERS